MKTVNKAIFFVLLVAILTSCNGFTSTSTASPEMETAVAKVWTEYAETQISIPTGTPAFVPPTAASGSFPFPTPNLGQQVYIDPEGWYFIYLPAKMKQAANKPSYYSTTGETYEFGTYLETGYLPEFGYMSNAGNVCFWIANIDPPRMKNIAVDTYETSISQSQYLSLCSVLTKIKSGNAENHLEINIFENPGADPVHRFIYVKTSHSVNWKDEFNYSFGWLKPIDEARYIPNLEPISPAEMGLWEKTAPILQNASVTEYELPPGGSDLYPGILVGDLPEEALPDWYKTPPELSTPIIATPENIQTQKDLRALGYELKQSETNPSFQQLFRDGRLLFDDVTGVSKVYKFTAASGTITAFIVNTWGAKGGTFNSFIIQNDAIYTWYYNHQDPHYPLSSPVLYQENLLWLKTTTDYERVNILKSNQSVVYSFAPYGEPLYSVSRFTTWNDHWILAARDFLFQDGESINKKMGFEEIFSWRAINDKPAYLFRKGSRIGFFYDGYILPLEYQNVARYLCCEPALDNPSIGEHEARFFGRRNGLWYYVIIKF